MRNIVSFFPEDVLGEAVEFFCKTKKVSFSGAANSSVKALLASGIFRKCGGEVTNTLWICSDNSEQNFIEKSLRVWGERPVFSYRKRESDEASSFPTYSDFEKTKDTEMLELVYRLDEFKDAIFVVDFMSLLQNFPHLENLKQRKKSIRKGEEVNAVDFIQDLVEMGYEMSDEKILKKGKYYRVGDSTYIFPMNKECVYRVGIAFDKVEDIVSVFEGDYAKDHEKKASLEIYPATFEEETVDVISLLGKNGMMVDDEVDVTDEFFDVWNAFLNEAKERCNLLAFTSFNEDEEMHRHLHFLSVLKYRSGYDLANDLRDKISSGWKVLFFTKDMVAVRGLMADQKVPFMEGINPEDFVKTSVFLVEFPKEEIFPYSFQNPDEKLLILSDTDLAFMKEEKKSLNKNIFNDFLMKLKVGDYVVHSDHGIAKFLGLDKKTVDGITKEYMKLGYAENDKLFVPIDQADKVNKYIGSEELMPKLTRLGSAEWNTITNKVKKETQLIAKELLKLYAERKAAKGFKFAKDSDDQEKFEKTFPYEETPGQIKAIIDTKEDMESSMPMDRLICGDVGFGKTEVAMRAAFKAVRSGKQVALISPITILADQHYKSFKKRMEEFFIRIEMLSRFRSQKEQKKIVERVAKGEVDIVIGTHRLLQPDVKFKNLGLVIIDEEQRFGVKQKEKLKDMKKEVDVLTLTATPIPRTLNICLNKLRDITTITTPPFGRLPIITEVRKYSVSLVREAIMREIKRGGQIYFLHNRVQTIDGFADKLKSLVPEARFCVAHGKLGSGDLEERVMAFKEGKYDVLVSSTIIENGIDLANANTLIVNNAERFGLAQLYQLRGRVGRGKKQAYAYFLYHGQRLKLDAKKRLRAIVEASDLGSGFQIAMKDLEIRGAGDILGANQHGVINVVGVAHFVRMLNKAVEDLKAGRVMEGEEEVSDVSIELPTGAYIPDTYIPESRDKINAYQRLSAADSMDYLKEVYDDLVNEYGKVPEEVANLFKVIEIKISAKRAGLIHIKTETIPMSKEKEIVLYMSNKVRPANIINLLEHNSKWAISGRTLRMNMKDLPEKWLEEIVKCVKKLEVAAKHGARGAS